MSKPDDDGLLSRWSRRKAAVREGTAIEDAGPELAPPSAEPVETEQDAEAAAARDAELQANREAAEAVDLDQLNEASDFSVFMKDGVPAALRRKAMSVLWRSNPVFANVDGLVDYDDDFASPGLILKTFQSGWQAGRGYLKEEPEIQAEETASQAEEKPSAEGETDSQDSVESANAGSAAEAPNVPESADTGAEEAKPIDADPTEAAAEAQETETLPRVSLRRRLALDEQA